MNKIVFYYTAQTLLLAGFIFIGTGIGKLFDKTCELFCISAGIGLIIVGIIFLKTYKRLEIFKK